MSDAIRYVGADTKVEDVDEWLLNFQKADTSNIGKVSKPVAIKTENGLGTLYEDTKTVNAIGVISDRRQLEALGSISAQLEHLKNKIDAEDTNTPGFFDLPWYDIVSKILMLVAYGFVIIYFVFNVIRVIAGGNR